jgi:hypothetical protein
VPGTGFEESQGPAWTVEPMERGRVLNNECISDFVKYCRKDKLHVVK